MTDRPQRVRATFEGQAIDAPPGATVAAALIGSGHRAWRTTASGRQRGLFCGIGICFDCLVEIDGESGQRACMIPLAEGMHISSVTRSAGAECGGAECGSADARTEAAPWQASPDEPGTPGTPRPEPNA